MSTARQSDASKASLTLENDLTIYNVQTQKTQLMEVLCANTVVELDLAQVREIDTSGIQLLILIKRESLRLGHTLRIVAHSPAVHETMDFLDLGSYFGDPLVIKAR